MSPYEALSPARSSKSSTSWRRAECPPMRSGSATARPDRQLRIYRCARVLEDHLHRSRGSLARGLAGDTLPQYFQVATGRLEQAGHNSTESGLAASAFTDQSERPPCRDRQVDAPKRLHGAAAQTCPEGMGDPFQAATSCVETNWCLVIEPPHLPRRADVSRSSGADRPRDCVPLLSSSGEPERHSLPARSQRGAKWQPWFRSDNGGTIPRTVFKRRAPEFMLSKQSTSACVYGCSVHAVRCRRIRIRRSCPRTSRTPGCSVVQPARDRAR